MSSKIGHKGQPRIQPAYSGFNYWLCAAQFGHAMNIALVRQGVVEHKRCVVRNVTTAPLAPAKGIQLPQPRIQPAYSGFNYWLGAAQFGHAMNIALVRQGVVEHKRCVVRNVTTAPLAPAKGIQLPQPRIQPAYSGFNSWLCAVNINSLKPGEFVFMIFRIKGKGIENGLSDWLGLWNICICSVGGGAGNGGRQNYY